MIICLAIYGTLVGLGIYVLCVYHKCNKTDDKTESEDPYDYC